MKLKTRDYKGFIQSSWHTTLLQYCVKGATNKSPDALSHNPVQEPLPVYTLAECNENSEPEISRAEIRWGLIIKRC